MKEEKLSIFIVEDEENLKTTLEYHFSKEGYDVNTFSNGLLALEKIDILKPDLIISDIMMPRLDGIEFCKEIRKKNNEIPFIFLTSRDEEFDRVLGLEIGADDYLCKPFSLRELTTRVKVMFRRVNRAIHKSNNIVSYSKLTLNIDSLSCKLDDVNIPLTVTEFRIMESLIKSPKCVKTREQLIKVAYPEENYISDRNIDCHIKRLRKKIQNVDSEFSNIKTVYGLGYKLD